MVACGTEEGEVAVWNTTSNAVILEKRPHESDVTAVSFSPDGVKLVSCGMDKSFKVFDLLTGMEVYSRSFQVELT